MSISQANLRQGLKKNSCDKSPRCHGQQAQKKHGQAQLKSPSCTAAKSNIKQPSDQGYRSGTTSMVAHSALCRNRIPVISHSSSQSNKQWSGNRFYKHRLTDPLFGTYKKNIVPTPDQTAPLEPSTLDTAMRLSSKGILGSLADTASRNRFRIYRPERSANCFSRYRKRF